MKRATGGGDVVGARSPPATRSQDRQRGQGRPESGIADAAVRGEDAMTSSSGPVFVTLPMAWRCSGSKPEPTRIAEQLNAGIEFRDTGCGVDREVLPLLLQHFFSTKDIGKGTGWVGDRQQTEPT